MTAFDVVFPDKGRQLFGGGQNSKFERSIISDNESPDCYNVVFSNGAVETRLGSTKLNTAAIGSFVGDGLYTRRDNTGAETMVAFAGGTAWQLATTTFTTIPSAQSVFTAGVRVGTAQYENHMFIGNGYVTPYKYNGVAFTRHGIPAATGVVSVNCTITGSLSGAIRYKITYVNSAVAEGDVGTATTTYTAANKSLTLTAIPTAPASHGVASRRVYRSIDGGSYLRIATIADNSTTSYVDDGTIAGTTAAPTDNGEPPKYSVLCQHQNRVFCNDQANPNFVWYSEIFEPYTFPSTNFLPIGDGSFDLVKGLDVYNNCVAVFCERATYLIYMPSTDDADWSVVKTRSPFGSRSPFGYFQYNNRLMVPSMQSDKFVGFSALSGSTLDPEATTLDTYKAGSELKSERIEDQIFNVQEAYVRNISAMVFKNKAYVTVTYGDNQTTNNRIFIYDFSISDLSKKQEAAWSPVTGLAAAQFTIYGGALYYISSLANGFVYKLEPAAIYSDDGSAINSYFWTKEFSGLKGHENLQKDFRKIRVLVEQAGAYNMNLAYRVDSDSGAGISQQVDLDPGGSVWNQFLWGSDVWGGGARQREVTVTLGQVTGKRIQFMFSNQNTAGQRFKVHGLNFTYNVKGKR